MEQICATGLATLGMLLGGGWLPQLRELLLDDGIGDSGVRGLCDGLCCSTATSLRSLYLASNQLGPLGAEALAAALRRGAMPKLESLYLGDNRLGCQGLKALAKPLRAHPTLQVLHLDDCGVGDEGVASLVDNLGKDDFKSLQQLWVDGNGLTDISCAKLVTALNAGDLPVIEELHDPGYGLGHRASQVAIEAVYAALHVRRMRNAA